MAKCPNIASEEWKNLVNEVGELEAYAVYIENGYDIPTDINKIKQQDSFFDRLEESEVENFRKVVNVRNKILNSLVTKFNIFEGSKKEGYIERLKTLIKDFEKADIDKALVLFMNNAETMMSSLEKKIHDHKGNLELLKSTNDFAGTYRLIDDVIKVLSSTPDKYSAIRSRASSISGRVKAFHDTYVSYAKDTLVDRLANESTIMRKKKEEELKSKYEEDFPRSKSSLSKKEYDNKKDEYVKNELNEARSEILKNEKTYIKQLLTLAPKDIGGFTRSLIDPRGVNDHIIQLAVKYLDKADFIAKESFIEDKKDVMKVWEKFIKGKSETFITDQKKLYNGLIEKVDGKETNYYTRPFYSHVYESKDKAMSEYYALINEGKRKQADQILIDWKKEYLTDTTKGVKLIYLKDKYKNPQWKELQSNKEKKELYSFLIEFNKESDSMVGRSKLGYKLPSLTKTFGERFKENKKSAIGKSIKEQFTLVESDYEFGELEKQDDVIKVLTDQHGKALKRIAVPFRTTLPAEEQSYDLLGMALTNRFVSLNYREKNLVKADLEVTKDILEDRRVTQQRNDKNLVQKIKNTLKLGDGELAEITQTIQGDQSNSFKLMEGILEDRLYGRHNIVAESIGNVSLDKAANMAIKFSSNNMLIANALGATTNLLAGKMANFFESTRRVHYSRADLRKAEKKYFNDFFKVSNDYGKLDSTAKTNLLVDKYLDTSMDFSGLDNDFTKDTKAKNILGVGTLHGLNGSAEHYIQGTLIYAVLNNIKVQNKQGKFINKQGQVVQRKDAMSMDEAYVKNEKNGLEWGNKDWTIEGFDEFDKDAEFYVSRKIKDVTADLQGNYDSKNRAQIQRYWYGKLAFFLRKWMIRGVQKRWRGVGDVGKDFDEIEDHKKFYSESSQEYKEGTYTSAIRFLKSIGTHIKTMKTELIALEWNKMSDMEKGNVKNAAIEVSVMVGALVSANLLAGLAKGADDEDEKKRLYTLAYLMRRQYGELVFYTGTNPGEATRTLRTPSATLSTLELSFQTVSQLMEDVWELEPERYEKGKRKGQSKSWVNLNKLFNPFYKNFADKDVEASYKFLTTPRYQ